MQQIASFTYEFSQLSHILEQIYQIVSLAIGKTIIFEGEPGVGKSTIVNQIIRKIEGDYSLTQSPTFTVVQEYENIIHMDLYMVSNSEKYLDCLLNIQEKLVLIEWGKKYLDFICWDYLVEISYVDENLHNDLQRRVRIYKP